MNADRPSFGVMLGRAVRLQCPWCGARRGILRDWFHRYDSCQNCGLSLQRGQEGFELGAASINAIVTLGFLIVAAAIAIAVMYPDVAWVPLIMVLAMVAIGLPILLYPFTFTIWFAIELVMEKPSPVELARASERVATAHRSGEQPGT